jgi:hypothetical protein
VANQLTDGVVVPNAYPTGRCSDPANDPGKPLSWGKSRQPDSCGILLPASSHLHAALHASRLRSPSPSPPRPLLRLPGGGHQLRTHLALLRRARGHPGRRRHGRLQHHAGYHLPPLLLRRRRAADDARLWQRSEADGPLPRGCAAGCWGGLAAPLPGPLALCPLACTEAVHSSAPPTGGSPLPGNLDATRTAHPPRPTQAPPSTSTPP